MHFKNISFDIQNLWKLFANGGNVDKANTRQSKIIREPVDFDAPISNAWSDGKHCQSLQAKGRGKVISLNRLPVVLDGVRVDIVDLVQKFIMGTLIVDREENESP